MKKIYVFSYEYDDENMCIGVVANTKKEAVWLFDYDDIWYEWNNPMEDLTCRIEKDIDVSNIDVWVIDQIRWVKNEIYYTCEWNCEICNNYDDLWKSWWFACCSECE